MQCSAYAMNFQDTTRILILSCLVLFLMVLTVVSVPTLGNDDDAQLQRNAGYIKASGIFLEAIKCMNNYELNRAEKLFEEAAVIYKELRYNKEFFLVCQNSRIMPGLQITEYTLMLKSMSLQPLRACGILLNMSVLSS